MQAVILAGGIGSRMRPLTYLIPKVMLPIGGRPLLEHTIRYLKEYDVSDFIVCIAYLKNRIVEYFKDGKALGVNIQYAEAEMPMGTGGQLKTAERYAADCFLALNGDIVTSLNIRHLLNFHEKHGGIGTIALKRFDVPVPYGHIELGEDDCYIKNFKEKPTFSFMANAGIYVLDAKIFKFIQSKQPVSLEKETFPDLLRNGERLNGYFQDAYWADVGTLTDFERVDKELLAKFYEGSLESSST